MGWSVYLLDQKNGLALEIGGSWASAFPVEVLIDVGATEIELVRRHRVIPCRQIAERLCDMAKSADYDVRISEGQEVPDGFKYMGAIT